MLSGVLGAPRTRTLPLRASTLPIIPATRTSRLLRPHKHRLLLRSSGSTSLLLLQLSQTQRLVVDIQHLLRASRVEIADLLPGGVIERVLKVARQGVLGALEAVGDVVRLLDGLGLFGGVEALVEGLEEVGEFCGDACLLVELDAYIIVSIYINKLDN